MASPKSAAVRGYAEEWSRRLFDDFRGVGVVRDMLAHDTSGGVTRILQGMLALAFTQSFLLATTLAHQEPGWSERGWVEELLAEERSSVLQVAGYGPVPLSRAQIARPRLNVPQAIGRLRELEAQATAAGTTRATGDGSGVASRLTLLAAHQRQNHDCGQQRTL
jgi:hypothetical protein